MKQQKDKKRIINVRNAKSSLKMNYNYSEEEAFKLLIETEQLMVEMEALMNELSLKYGVHEVFKRKNKVLTDLHNRLIAFLQMGGG